MEEKLKLKESQSSRETMIRNTSRRRVHKFFHLGVHSPNTLRPWFRWIISRHCIATTSDWAARAQVSAISPAIQAMFYSLPDFGVEETVEQSNGKSLQFWLQSGKWNKIWVKCPIISLERETFLRFVWLTWMLRRSACRMAKMWLWTPDSGP